jgi:hypothetical protein
MLNTVLVPAPSFRPRIPPIAAPIAGAAPRWGFPELFVISQTALPAMMFLPGSQMLRVPIRAGAFAISLLGLLYLWHAKRDPRRGSPAAQFWLLCAMIYLGFMLLHPTTNSLKAGSAQIVLYLAVLAPVFWAPALVRWPKHLTRVLWLLLICNGVNSLVGVLQVYNPAVWMPEELSRGYANSPFGIESVSYVGPDGRWIIRPPGLFDAPGAVCGPAMITVLLGLFFSARARGLVRKLGAIFLAMVGLAAIYLSHVRSSLIVVTITVLVLTGMLMFMQRQKLKGSLLLVLYGLLILASFSVAVVLGGQSVYERFATLFENDPFELYYASRGEQLEHGFRVLLVDYPFGAGLGRWGMINVHFGDHFNFKSSPIWAEVQPNAWILDGGVILLSLYGLALAASSWTNLKMVITEVSPDRRLLAVAVLAANIGMLALIFSFTPFTTQIGMQYWLLSGALYGALALRPRPAT